MKFDMKIGECMTVGVITLPSDATAQAAAKLIKDARIGSILVTEKGKAIGILTERDIVIDVVAAGRDPAQTPLKAVMSKPLKVIGAHQSIQDAALALKENKVKRLPVVDKKGRMVGILSEGDLVRVFPGLLDILSEESELGPYQKERHVYTGVCEKCGLHSSELKMESRKLLCEECIEEDEV